MNLCSRGPVHAEVSNGAFNFSTVAQLQESLQPTSRAIIRKRARHFVPKWSPASLPKSNSLGLATVERKLEDIEARERPTLR